jgi:hypothetical protein
MTLRRRPTDRPYRIGVTCPSCDSGDCLRDNRPWWRDSLCRLAGKFPWTCCSREQARNQTSGRGSSGCVWSVALSTASLFSDRFVIPRTLSTGASNAAHVPYSDSWGGELILEVLYKRSNSAEWREQITRN